MKKIFLLACVILATGRAPGAVLINLDAELLKNSSGAPMNGLAILMASPTASFNAPTATSFLNGNAEVYRWNVAGGITEISQSIDLSLSVQSGYPLQLYWFPGLSTGSTAPGAGATYGSYRDGTGGVDGGDVWTVPIDGQPRTLVFATSDATVLFSGGSNPSAAGLAITPVPESAFYSVTCGLLCFGFVVCRRMVGSKRSE